MLSSNSSQVMYRTAEPDDVPALARLGARLARQHLAYDAERFTCSEPVENAYEQFFREQVPLGETFIMLAEVGKDIVGYVFVRVEPESFVDLLGSSAWIHDIYVEVSARGSGIGPTLLAAATAAARELGARSVMLTVSPKNERAKEIFEKQGFRVTMLEMRLEL